MSSDLLQYTPLTQSIVRSLTDKLYEKRKAAALEIEKYFFVFVYFYLFNFLLHIRCFVSN